MIWKQPIQIVTMNNITNSFCSHTVGQVKVERGEEVGDGEGMSLEDDVNSLVWCGLELVRSKQQLVGYK